MGLKKEEGLMFKKRLSNVEYQIVITCLVIAILVGILLFNFHSNITGYTVLEGAPLEGEMSLQEDIGCVVPYENMLITQDTTFCYGIYYLANGVKIESNDISLDCNGAILTGNFSDRSDGIRIKNYFNITIKNCKIKNYYRALTASNNVGTEKDLTIKDSEFYNCTAGFYIGGINNTVVDNISCYDTIKSHCLYLDSLVDQGMTNVIVRNSKFYNNFDSSALQLNTNEKTWIKNVSIYNNDIYNSKSAINEIAGGNALIYNNNIFNNTQWGIALEYDRSDKVKFPARNDVIFNNTFYDNPYSISFGNLTQNNTVFSNNYPEGYIKYRFRIFDISFDISENNSNFLAMFDDQNNILINFTFVGLKKFTVINNTININSLAVPYNDIYDNTNKVLIANNVNEYTLTIQPNQEIIVGNFSDEPSVCGDNTCNANESCSNCQVDCGACLAYCGDNTCNIDESCSNCSVDCGECLVNLTYCGDGICQANESCSNCSGDCGVCVVSVSSSGGGSAGRETKTEPILNVTKLIQKIKPNAAESKTTSLAAPSRAIIPGPSEQKEDIMLLEAKELIDTALKPNKITGMSVNLQRDIKFSIIPWILLMVMVSLVVMHHTKPKVPKVTEAALITWISRARNAGLDNDDIYNRLAEKGWKRKYVESLLGETLVGRGEYLQYGSRQYSKEYRSTQEEVATVLATKEMKIQGGVGRGVAIKMGRGMVGGQSSWVAANVGYQRQGIAAGRYDRQSDRGLAAKGSTEIGGVQSMSAKERSRVNIMGDKTEDIEAFKIESKHLALYNWIIKARVAGLTNDQIIKKMQDNGWKMNEVGYLVR